MSKKPLTAALLPPPGDPARCWVAALLALAPLGFGLLALLLGQSVAWDLRNYHWYNAWAYLTGRYDSDIDFLPSQLQFFFNPWMDLPFYMLATHLPLKLAVFILGAVQGLNFPLLFMLSYAVLKIKDTRHKSVACAALSLMGMLGGMGISEIGAQFYDNVTSIGVLLSALLIVRNLDTLLSKPWRETMKIVVLAGLPVGIATGLKLTVAPFCVGLCLALWIAGKLDEKGFTAAFFFGLGVTAGVLLSYGHWGWYLYTHYDSPLFPFFNRIFNSPHVPPGYIEDFVVPNRLPLQLLYPFLFSRNPLLVNEIWWQDWRIATLYALMIAAGIFRLALPKRVAWGQASEPAATVFLLSAAAVSYCVWISVEAVYRYLLPLEMLAPLLIALCLGLLPLKRPAIVAALVLLALVATLRPGDWGRRHDWADKIADVRRPVVTSPGNTMILMAGNDAYAYMIPEFPPEISFVRLQSRAFHPEQGWGINKLIWQRVYAHNGKILLLIPAGKVNMSAPALHYFGLKLLPRTCREVTDMVAETEKDDLFPRMYRLCDIEKGMRQ
ncbi:MAG: hypothetical protein EPN97_11615 [Alphaproteobacteria bacterium]|nr:MAG: hypothetical protein EPN97_11615 [Alphaproteobacteria bacterium]